MGNVTSSSATSACEVKFSNGTGRIRGVQFESKVRRFANIPYALPPTGDLRWRRPEPLPTSFSYMSPDGMEFDGTTFGQVCPQPNYSASVTKHKSSKTYGEDCLRLNIWTPCHGVSKDLSPQWPVMIWFHGGWFQIGDPNQDQSMNPIELVHKSNVVFVAVGYRLNVFGFLAGDALRAESDDQSVGNYGLWDQRLAMEWVYKNIAAFGGDPNNITLSGRSAGAYAVQAQTLYDFRGSVSESTRNRFRRLVMQSNAIPTQPKRPEDCQPQFDELCSYFGISIASSGAEKLKLLRKVPAEDLSKAIMQLKNHTFRPVTDDIFIHHGMFDYFNNGSFAAEFKHRRLRLFIGEVLNEETLYAATNGPEANLQSLERQVSNYYSTSVTHRLMQHYTMPLSSDKKDWEATFGHIISDGQVRAPSRFLIKNLVQHGVEISDVWRYMIGYRLSFITEEIAPESFGVSHSMDKPFWNYSLFHGPTISERLLMEEWIDDLAAFVGDNKNYCYGTKDPDEFKVITAAGKIEIMKDDRWVELVQLMSIFSGFP